MSVLNVDTPKAKRSQPRRWGCLKLLLIPIVLAAACYGGMWLFARYGGEWAMRDQIPVPPDSEQINVFYGDGEFTMKTVFYVHNESPEWLQEWFIDQGIWAGSQNYADREGYSTSLGYEVMTSSRSLHREAVRFVHPEFSWIGNMQAGCGGWTIFKTKDAPQARFPQIILDVPENKTVFAIHTCWPNVEKLPPNQF